MDALRDERSVAEILGVRPATLQQWRWLGKGPTFIKVGGRIRYTDADISEFIDRQRRQSTSDDSRPLGDANVDR